MSECSEVIRFVNCMKGMKVLFRCDVIRFESINIIDDGLFSSIEFDHRNDLL